MKLFDSIPVEAVVTSDYATSGVKAEYWLKPAQLRKAVQCLRDDAWHIEDISVLDIQEGRLAEYHFDKMKSTGRIVLKVMAENDTLPSITDIFEGANWHEREAHDFHALVFTDHPQLWPLLLPVETPPGVLLKEAQEKKPLRTVLTLGEAEQATCAVEALFAEPEAKTADDAATE